MSYRSKPGLLPSSVKAYGSLRVAGGDVESGEVAAERVKHLQSMDETIDDLLIICQQNGGTLA